MVRFIAVRAVRAGLTILGVITIAFFILRLGGSPAALMLGTESTPDDVARLNKAYGFDKSVFEQYWRFISQAVRGNFGDSLYFRRSSARVLLGELPQTLKLAGAAFLFGIVTASILHLVVELKGGAKMRDALLWIGALVQAIPPFLLGIMLVLVFAIWLTVLPALGASGWQAIVLPMVTLGLYQVALYLRLFSVAFAEQRSQDYVRTAYAKGQSHAKVVLRHILPNASLPILTVAGINLGQLIGGTVVVETVFNWPGIGSLIYRAVSGRDYPLVQAGVVVIAALFVLVNVVVDLVTALLDPRVRLS